MLPAMSIRGRYKIGNRRRPLLDDLVGASVYGSRRVQRILESLLQEITSDEPAELRIRKIFSSPREIYRVELEKPEIGYQRTTLLDREALEELLLHDGVRARLGRGRLGDGAEPVPGAGLEPARPMARRF